MANVPFTTQDGFSSTTSTVEEIVFGNGSIQTSAFTGTVSVSDITGLAAVATSGAYSDLSGTPSLAAVATSGAYSDLSGTPSLAAVATSGAYSDLSGTPSLAAVATSGSYDDLSDKPYIPDQSVDTDASPSFTGLTVASQIFPTADGTNGQVITTNGSGTLSWTDQTGGGSGVSSISAGTGTYVSSSTGAVTIWTDGGGGSPGVTNIYARDELPAGTTGTIITISDSGSDTNSPAGNWAPAYWDPDNSVWTYIGNSNSVTDSTPPPPPSGPPVTDYIAWYDVDSYIGTVWYDKSVNGSNASSAGVSIASVSGFGASALTSAIDGSSGSGSIEFPTGILNSSGYTLFHVTRRISGNSGRIMTAPSTDNWFSGHWQSNAGVCFHDGWLTGTSDYYADNWLINVDQQYFYRPNGNVALQGSGGGGLIPATIGISISSSEPCAGWQIVEVIIYDRELNSTEISDTETYLATRYGITLGV